MTVLPVAVHANGGPPGRSVSPNMSVDGGSKPGGGGRGGSSPTPSLSSEKTLTEAEIVVSALVVSNSF